MAKLKIIFNGTEYLIKDTKLKDAIAAMHVQLSVLEERPGLYQNGKLVESWDSLVSSGAIVVNDGVVSTGVVLPEGGATLNEYGFYWDFWYEWGAANPLIMFHEDGSCELTGIAAEVLGFTSAPAGTIKYEVGRIDANEVGFTTLTPSSDGTVLNHEYGYEFTVVLGTRPEFIGKLVLSDNGDITAIGESAFQNQLKLTSVVIPDSVTSIGNNAFYQSGLVSVAIGSGVTDIADYAFDYCYNLVEVINHSDLNIVAWGGNDYGCVSQNALEVHDGESKLVVIDGGFVFYPTDDAYCFITYHGKDTELVFPDNCKGKGYIIPSYVFSYYNLNITSIVIPEGVTIGERAFEGCSSLTSATINTNNVGEDVFAACDNLTSITIGDGVTNIGDQAFSGCYRVTSITIPDSVTNIGEYAFSSCGFTSIEIPGSVTTIGKSAFYGCESLTSVTFASGVPSMDTNVFDQCYNITELYITDIADWCENCTGSILSSNNGTIYLNNEPVTELVIPDGVTKIGPAAFYNCSGLTSVAIPDSVTSIDSMAFYGCSSLTSITIPEGVTRIDGYVFQNCTSLASVTIPDSVTSIGGSVFRECSNLTSVNIPSSVTSIGSYTFYGCSGLTSIIIPDSVTNIDRSAFRNCKKLTSMTFEGTIEQWNAITKGSSWNLNAPATEVVCSDGSVTL